MSIVAGDFRARVRALLEQRGTVLTDEELARLAERYPACGGRGHWDVRAYARRTSLGAREFRVVRGDGVQDVYCSVQPESAAAVRTALNELESQEQSRDG